MIGIAKAVVIKRSAKIDTVAITFETLVNKVKEAK